MSMSRRLGASPRLCFEKYVDVRQTLVRVWREAKVSTSQSMLDLLIPGQSPGIKERLVDLYTKPEILFFGPDGAAIYFSNILGNLQAYFAEGTADMMDWAARTFSFHLCRAEELNICSTCP